MEPSQSLTYALKQPGIKLPTRTLQCWSCTKARRHSCTTLRSFLFRSVKHICSCVWTFTGVGKSGFTVVPYLDIYRGGQKWVHSGAVSAHLQGWAKVGLQLCLFGHLQGWAKVGLQLCLFGHLKGWAKVSLQLCCIWTFTGVGKSRFTVVPYLNIYRGGQK